MKTTFVKIISAAFLICSFNAAATATVLEFVPPNDPVGQVFTTNSNDGYNMGRGDVFGVSTNQTLSSIGIKLDVTNQLVTYTIAQANTVSPSSRAGELILATGSSNVSTLGLQFVDFSIPNIMFLMGNFYDISFSFTGNANQNFFFNNRNVRFSNGAFNQIDGENGGDVSNSVMPDIRITVANAAAVPEPATVALFGLGLLGFAASRRKSAK